MIGTTPEKDRDRIEYELNAPIPGTAGNDTVTPKQIEDENEAFDAMMGMLG